MHSPLAEGRSRPGRSLWLVAAVWLLWPQTILAAPTEAAPAPDFPPPIASYGEAPGTSLHATLRHRVQAEPLNLAATAIFLLAIVHTFVAPMFLRLAHRLEARHRAQLPPDAAASAGGRVRGGTSFRAELCHFLGEVEAIFGIWVVPLLVVIALAKGWPTARDYIGHLNFTEPLFVVVIMTMAASRPILRLAEQLMTLAAALGRGSPAGWWLAILTLGPVLGSFITEPAAMTISALLLAGRFYRLQPSPKLAYATLGLLFVNVSIGGTLTHFAAPPVLMVAGKWGWGLGHMLAAFGWKSFLAILAANSLYWLCFRGEFRALAGRAAAAPPAEPDLAADPPPRIPPWITGVHLGFLTWTVVNSHIPSLFVGGFLFYLAFTEATERYQGPLSLRPALLVGFFLAGLVVHGSLQGWWIAPVLSGLTHYPLYWGAVILTSFNDNAAITYLASLVPGFSPDLQYSVMAGAVAGGGLTVIANAPNPAGQSILSRFFPEGVSPWRLALGALAPTLIVSAAYLLLGGTGAN